LKKKMWFMINRDYLNNNLAKDTDQSKFNL